MKNAVDLSGLKMNEFFDIIDETKIEEELSTKIQDLTIFSYLQDVTHGKRGNIHLERDLELKKFSSFMILRYLSLDINYCPLVAILNQYQGVLSKEEMYKILLFLIPRARKFLQYPKINKDNGVDEESLKLIKNYFQISMEETITFVKLKLLSVYDIEQIKNAYGGKQIAKKKEIKKKKQSEEE